MLLDRPAPTQLRGDVDKTNLEMLKRIAGTEQKAVVMATYVDDCDMDGKKEYKSLMWAVVRVCFESADPEDVKKVSGIIHEVCIEKPDLYVAKMNQRDYVMNMLDNLPEDPWQPLVCGEVHQARLVLSGRACGAVHRPMVRVG